MAFFKPFEFFSSYLLNECVNVLLYTPKFKLIFLLPDKKTFFKNKYGRNYVTAKFKYKTNNDFNFVKAIYFGYILIYYQVLKGNTSNFKKRSFEIYIIKKKKKKKFYNSIPFPLSEKSVYISFQRQLFSTTALSSWNLGTSFFLTSLNQSLFICT